MLLLMEKNYMNFSKEKDYVIQFYQVRSEEQAV